MKNRLTVKPQGNIVSSNANLLKEELMAELHHEELALDLSEVKMIDSNGIGVLLAVNREVKNKGGVFKLIKVPASIVKLFTMMRFDRHFEIIPDNIQI